MSSAADENPGTPIELPDLGVGNAPIQFVQWLVDVGGEVIEGERVAEVLADGVLFSVSAPASGMLTKVVVSADTVVDRNTVLGWIRQPGRADHSP